MTFYQASSGSTFDPVFSDLYDERLHSFRISQDHCRNFYTDPFKSGSASPPNVELNYPIIARNVPCPTFSRQSCQLPYASHAVVANKIQSDPWANICSSETYFPASQDNCSRFLNNSLHDCCNVQRNLTQPDHVYSSFLQLDREYLVSCSAGWNQQSFDAASVNVSPSPMQHYHCPTYPFSDTETMNSGTDDCFPVLHNYSVDKVMQNTMAASGKLTGEDGTTFDMHSSLLGKNNLQWPTFSHSFSHNEPHFPIHNLEANNGIDTTFSGIVDYGAEAILVKRSESVSRQSLDEISSFPSSRRMLTDFKVNSGGCTGYTDCNSSCMMISSAVETHVNNIDMISTTAQGCVCQTVPEMPQSIEQPVTFTPSINTDDMLRTEVESTCCCQILSQCSKETVMDVSHAVVGGMGVSGISVKEGEQIGVGKDEMSTSLTDTVAVNSFANSTTMLCRNWQLQADSSEKTPNNSAINLAHSSLSELNVNSKHMEGSLEPMSEVTETAESHAVTCESLDTISNTSSDVIVLSPLSADDILTAPVFTHPTSNAVRSYCHRMQPLCEDGHPNTENRLDAFLRPAVPNSLPVRPHHIGRHTVGAPHCRSSPSIPFLNHTFSKSTHRNVLPGHAKCIGNHSCSIPATDCQIYSPHCAISSIPATSWQSSADITSFSSVKPMLCYTPITAMCDLTQTVPVRQHPAQTEPKQLLHLTPSSTKDELLKPKACNSAVESNNCNHVLENSQHARLQKSFTLSPASSQALPQLVNARHNPCEWVVPATSASHNISSISLSALSHSPSAVRTNPMQSQCTNYKSHSLPVYRHHGSTVQLQGMSLRHNGTYSIKAANILLQRLKQAKLSDFTSAYSTRRQLLNRNRKLSLPSHDGGVIDLTGDDDSEQDMVETCEFIFARTRRHTASMALLRRPRQNFFRRSSFPDVSFCDPKRQPRRTTFAVDQSLPFYRCFVQKLLRNYKFTSSGGPVKIFPEISPPPVAIISSASGGVRSKARGCTHNELVKTGQPVVLLKKLDESVINRNGKVNVGMSQSGEHVLAASCRSKAEKCVRDVSSLSRNVSEKLQSGESQVVKDSVPVSHSRASTNYEHKMIEFDSTERESCGKENMAVKRQCDEAVSLCRPVSVLLERLDRTKIHEIGNKLCKTEPCCQDNQRITQLSREVSACDLSWTVTLVPRANKIPLLVIRASTLSTQQQKVTTNSNVCPTRQLRSTSKCLTTRSCTAGVCHRRNSASHSSGFNTPGTRILKKMPNRGKLCFRSSLLRSLRSRNYNGRVLRSHSWTPVTRPPCQVSSEYLQKQSSTPLLVKTAERGKKIYSEFSERFCEPESLATSAEQDVHLVASDMTNVLSYDSAVNQNLPEDCGSSDSSTIELSPCSLMDVNSSDDQDVNSVTSNSFPKNALSPNLSPHNSVFNDDLPDDCVSSDSDTVPLSPHSSTTDFTIICRSPLSNLLDFADGLLLAQPAGLEENLGPGNSSEMFDIDQELKPTSYLDCDKVSSQHYATTVSTSMQFPRKSAEISAFSESLSCGLVASSQQWQPRPVHLVSSLNGGIIHQHAISNCLSELMDTAEKKSEMTGSVSTEMS